MMQNLNNHILVLMIQISNAINTKKFK